MSNYARFEPNENTINDYFNNAIGGKIDVTGEPVPVNVHMASKARPPPCLNLMANDSRQEKRGAVLGIKGKDQQVGRSVTTSLPLRERGL
jgi:hypothetical protein